MTDTLFHSACGSVYLERRPPAPNQPLQAWDAADDYLLEMAARQAGDAQKTLIINDSFGALAVALRERGPHSWGDSCTAHLALADNLARNGASQDEVIALPATRAPDGPYDLVLWRIPKSIALFEQQAARLRDAISGDTLIWAGGMIKHLPQQSVDILRRLGVVDILHAQKKARLFHVTPDTTLPKPVPCAEKRLRIPEYQLELGGDANVFARDKFDIGARFFLEQLTRLPQADLIADLGCGNGVLGIVAQQQRPGAILHFFDESYQAVAAAESNYRRNIHNATQTALFTVDDCLSHYRGEPFDVILCNPPFHQNHVVGDQIAWRMFGHSARHLRNHGELWIVGNRHLQYHIKLKRLFGNVRQIAANPKFVVLAARKEPHR